MKIIGFQLPCHQQGHLPPDQGAQSSIQPGLEPCQGGGSHSFSGQPGPGFHHPRAGASLRGELRGQPRFDPGAGGRNRTSLKPSSEEPLAGISSRLPARILPNPAWVGHGPRLIGPTRPERLCLLNCPVIKSCHFSKRRRGESPSPRDPSRKHPAESPAQPGPPGVSLQPPPGAHGEPRAALG